MKRIYLCAALLLCAAACAPAPTDNANSNANMSNMNAANSNMMSAASWTDDDVIAGDRKANANTANANAANANRANANAANSNGAATAASPAMMTADVEANEKAVWDALKRKDWDAFASFLAEDSLEVEGRGVYDKAGTLSSVKAFDFTSTSLSDCKATVIDGGAKINTCTVKGMDPNKKPFTERATTIWVNRGGKWMAAFHQGTTVAKPAM
ncbi:MAG: nuclear transport factor 2 family protein [Acidobacteria bacterium]|nr:nuclear transport factor 2 family protein [Acidobacteriota bacterium]